MLHVLETVPEREIHRGFHGRIVHAGTMTLAFWRIDAGAALPAHTHPHEQIVQMLEGEFDLVVDGEPVRLHAGWVYVIPPGAVHSGGAVTDCRIIDAFCPVRADWLAA